VECSRHSGIGHVATTVGLTSTHWSLSESFCSWWRIRGLSVWNWLLCSTLAVWGVKVLLRHRGVVWLRLYIRWWLVLLILQSLILWCHSLWLSNRRLAVGRRFHSHLIGHRLVGKWTRCTSFDYWSLGNSLGRNELLTLRNWSKLLLSIVSNMFFILPSLFSKFLINFLSEFFHELSNSSLNLLVNQISHSFPHVVRNLLKLIVIILWSLRINFLIFDRLSCFLWTSFNHWPLYSILRLISWFNWWCSTFIFNIFSIIWHLMVHQDIFSDHWNIVIDQIVSIIMLLIVTQKLFNRIHIHEFWGISLSSSLIASIWFGIDASEWSWLNLETILASGNHHVLSLHFGADNDTILVVQVRVAHDESLRVSIVLNQFEVVSSFPVVLLLKDTDILEVLLSHLDHTSLILHMERSISHHEVIENLNLLELGSQVFWEFSFTDTVAVDTKGEIFFEPSESFWLPFHVNIEPVVTLIEIWNLNIGITILTSYFSVNQSAAHHRVGWAFLYQVGNAICILVIGSSWKQSLTELRNGERVHTFLAYFNSCQMIIWLLVPVSELWKCLVVALHHHVWEHSFIKGFVNRPKTKNFFEIIEIHPENTIITFSIKLNLISELLGPERRIVAPVSIPLATTPWVS